MPANYDGTAGDKAVVNAPGEQLVTATQQEIEFFTLTDSEGQIWSAPRQAIGNGLFRTPDDPTTSAESIHHVVTATAAGR